MAVGGAMTGTGVSTAKSDYMYSAKGHVGYFEEKMKINNFDVMFGARFEYIKNFARSGTNTSQATGGEEDMFAFAPGGGLVYNHDNNWQWFAGVYKGFNIPGPSSALDLDNDGDPVEKETSIAKEIGMRFSGSKLNMQAIGFHTDFKDLIVLNNSNTDGKPDNAGNVVTKGIELNIDYLPPEEYQFLPVGDYSFLSKLYFTNANLRWCS